MSNTCSVGANRNAASGSNEAADEPRAGNAVDLGPLAGNPPVFGGRAPPAAGQTEFGPTGYPALEIPRVDIVGAQRHRDTLAYLMAVDAIDDHRALSGQVSFPCGYLLRVASQRANDDCIIRLERGGSPHIEQHWRTRGADAGIKVERGNRGRAAHECTPRIASCAELGPNRLMGVCPPPRALSNPTRPKRKAMSAKKGGSGGGNPEPRDSGRIARPCTRFGGQTCKDEPYTYYMGSGLRLLFEKSVTIW